MNTYQVTIVLDTLSPAPEDWITESIIDQLELDEGETIRSLEVKRVTVE